MHGQYRRLHRRMECIQHDDWRRWIDGQCDAAKTAADTGNSKELYSIVRQLGGKSLILEHLCKGDNASQWGNGKFDPLPCPYPITDRHQKLHT